MQELDLQTIFSVLLRRIRWILLSTVLAAVLFGVGAKLFVAETYQSKFQMYVSNYSDLDESSETKQNVSSSGLLASQTLTGEYIVILKNDLVLNEVSSRLAKQGYTMTTSEIRKALSLSAEGETAMLNISATTSSPQLSRAICDAMASVAPAKLRDVMRMGTATVMAPAKLGVKVGPSIMKDAMIGALLGAVLSCAVFIVLHLTDNTVSGEREIRRRLNLTVLGEIPSIQPEKKGGVARGRGK